MTRKWWSTKRWACQQPPPAMARKLRSTKVGLPPRFRAKQNVNPTPWYLGVCFCSLLVFSFVSLCAPASTVIIWLKNKYLHARFLHGSGAIGHFHGRTVWRVGGINMVALSQASSANAQIAAATTPGGGADPRDRGSRKVSVKAFNKGEQVRLWRSPVEGVSTSISEF